jgi:hypothetical protein
MLIVLDKSLADALEANPSPFSATAIALDAAADAFQRGHHVLHGELAVLDRLAKITKAFNQRTSQVLLRARVKAPYRRSLIEAVKWFVQLTDAVPVAIVRPSVFGNAEICIPTSLVAQSPTLFNKVIVITENLNDVFFYEGLSRALLKADPQFKRNFSDVNLRYEPKPGGGHTTAQLYSHEKITEKHFCLAIVDSDKTWPGAGMGMTATALHTIDALPNSPNWNARQITIGVRAVENMIPHKNFIAAANAVDSNVACIAQHSVSQFWGKDCWEYLPHKKGVKCFDLKPETPESHYWRNELNFGRCPNFSDLECDKRETCKTYVVAPLSTLLLAKVCEKKPPSLEINREEDDMVLSSGRTLMHEMLSALCAENAMLLAT